MPNATPTPAAHDAAPVTAEVVDTEHQVDLRVTGAPLMTFGPKIVTPVNLLIAYEDAGVTMIRVSGRGPSGFVDYYPLNNRAEWPEWLAGVVEEHRPANRAEVRSAALTEAADATAAWTGDDTPMEDRPGYDGPVIDPEDRLRTAIDPEVPSGLRDQLIAEHRQMVTDEITAELRRLAATTPTRQEK